MGFLDNSFFFDHFGVSNVNTEFDQIRGTPLKNCPSANAVLGAMPYPTVVFTFIIMGAVSFFFFLLLSCKYNSVRVFNKKIRTDEISNTLWIFLYLFLGIRSFFLTLPSSFSLPLTCPYFLGPPPSLELSLMRLDTGWTWLLTWTLTSTQASITRLWSPTRSSPSS